jgi:hypothetical protein
VPKNGTGSAYLMHDGFRVVLEVGAKRQKPIFAVKIHLSEQFNLFFAKNSGQKVRFYFSKSLLILLSIFWPGQQN